MLVPYVEHGALPRCTEKRWWDPSEASCTRRDRGIGPTTQRQGEDRTYHQQRRRWRVVLPMGTTAVIDGVVRDLAPRAGAVGADRSTYDGRGRTRRGSRASWSPTAATLAAGGALRCGRTRRFGILAGVVPGRKPARSFRHFDARCRCPRACASPGSTRRGEVDDAIDRAVYRDGRNGSGASTRGRAGAVPIRATPRTRRPLKRPESETPDPLQSYDLKGQSALTGPVALPGSAIDPSPAGATALSSAAQ